MDVANLVRLYEGTNTDNWAAFLEGKDDALRNGVSNEMVDAMKGREELRGKLAAADEMWTVGGDASRLFLVSMTKSDKRGGAVHEHALVPESDPETEEYGRATPMDVAGHVCDAPKCACGLLCASRKVNGR